MRPVCLALVLGFLHAVDAGCSWAAIFHWQPWSPWSSCTRPCGGGTRQRVRHCSFFQNTTNHENGTCNQFCYNGGSFYGGICNCRTGNFEPKCCSDVNECQSNRCQQMCTNTVGSYRCSCHSGYRLAADGHGCIDVDECMEGVAQCDHRCVNTLGSFKCECHLGFSLGTNRRSCLDFDECASNNGGCHHICSNTHGSYSCSCRTGYALDTGDKRCTDVDECTNGTFICDHTCSNTPGSYVCSCNKGYQLQTNGVSCIDINECSLNNGGCSQKCLNKPGSFQCECTSGYRLQADHRTCKDIDECAEQTSGCPQTCNNTAGSYKCSCRPGFVLSTDGKRCDDIDECIGVTCEHGGTCVDKLESYTCVCRPGYTGRRCESDIDECADSYRCAETCINTEGSFKCQCSGNRTLSSDGFSCGGANNNKTTVFERENIVGHFLPRGCSTLMLTRCTEGKDIQLLLSSTSLWYQLRSNDRITFTPGVVFAELNNLSMPISLTGVEVVRTDSDFKLVSGSLRYKPIDGIKLNKTNRHNCWSFDITPLDIHNFLTSGSFLKTFFKGIESVLPDWLKFSNLGTTIFDLNGLTSQFMHGPEIGNDVWCRGAPVIDDHLYTVLKFGGDIQITLYGNSITVPKPLHDKKFCFIIDICQDYGGSFFLMLPAGSRDILEMFDLFKSLRDSKGIRLQPRGIGLSLLKNINVHSQTSAVRLWNGEFFSYSIFPRGNVWVGGDASLDNSVLSLKAQSDIFLSLPAPNEILYSVFYGQWDAYLNLQLTTSLQIKLNIANKAYILDFKLFGHAQVEAYSSLGGVTTQRNWCGPTANPSGLFLSFIADVNPFSGVPILESFQLNVNARVYAFFSTDPTTSVSELNKIDILQDVLHLDELVKQFTTSMVRTVVGYSLILTNESLSILHDLEMSAHSFVDLIDTTIKDIRNLHIGDVIKSVSHIWKAGFSKLEGHAHAFVDSIEFNNNAAKYRIKQLVESELEQIKRGSSQAVEKIFKQVINAVKDFDGIGLRFSGSLKVFGLKIFQLDIEFAYSLDRLGTCSKFQRVYEMLKSKMSIRILGIATTDLIRLGRFLRLKNAGPGIGMACSVDGLDTCIVQIHAQASLLGIKAAVDIFIDKKGLQFYLEGDVWNTFRVELDVFAEHGKDWDDLLLGVQGKFLANSDNDNNFDDSYLDGIRKLFSSLGNEANKRITQVQNTLTVAQSGLTKAQRWFTEKENSVIHANIEFDNAVSALEHAKHKLDEAKGPFQRAIEKLNRAQRKVDNLCRIRTCSRVCVPGVKCRICHKKIWGVRIPYPCCHFTSCMFSFPNPICVAANLACRAVRALAYGALELAKFAVRIPMLALDTAKAALSVAEVIVDKSRVVLDIAVGAMELAKFGLEGAKGVLQVAKDGLEGVKTVVRIGLNIFNLIVKYGLQSLVDARNCGFNVQLSAVDKSVFSVSCEVRVFRAHWQKVQFMINFKDPLRSMWQAAKTTGKVLADTLFHIVSGKKKREVATETVLWTHKVIRVLRNADSEDEVFELRLNETINITFQTPGFRNTSGSVDDVESRINIFKEKCTVFRNTFAFFSESNEVLLNIMNDTVLMINNMSSLQDELSSFNMTELQNNFDFSNTGINADVAMRDYNLTKENLTSAFQNSKDSFEKDPLLNEITSMADIAKSHVASQSKELENIKVTDHWLLAMENVTIEYFGVDECASFLDCAHYAITEMYDLFYAESLPNTTESLNTISMIEDLFLDLTGNSSNGITQIYNLTSEIDLKLKHLKSMALFCSEAPVLSTPLGNQTVKNGTTVSMVCNATGHPDPTFWWYIDDVLDPDQHAMVLTLNSSEAMNGTRYQCIAGNIVANRTSDVAHIIVEEYDSPHEVDAVDGVAPNSQILQESEGGGDDTVHIIVPSVLGGCVAVAVLIGILVWRAVVRHKFRKAMSTGSFASFNMVRPESSMVQKQNTGVTSVQQLS